MIHFVTTRSHGYTLRHLVANLGRGQSRRWTYEHLFNKRRLPGGTWIFTDHERLSALEISLAATIATLLEKSGAIVLNHPGRVRGRHELLHNLKLAGINAFSAWRCELMPRPNSFPVFIRNEFDHVSRGIDLIENQSDLDARLAGMEASGTPLPGKLVIEYAGEEREPGVWQRFATYRAGDALIAHHHTVSFRWVVKDVEDRDRLHNHPNYQDFVATERDFVHNDRYQDVLRRAFDLARIDYGRADFSIVAGIPQIYEINTNPYHGSRRSLFRDTHPDRLQTQLLSEERLRAAILALNTTGRDLIELDDPVLKRQQGLRRFFSGTRRP